VSRSLSRIQAWVLGSIVVLAIGLAALALFTLHERYGLGRDSFRVVAGFPDIGGVEIGTRVRVQGIDAGEVEDILPPAAAGEPVRLKLRVAGKYRHLVGADARVQIAAEGLLPGKVVRILPGRSTAAPITDGAELASVAAPELVDELSQAAGKLNRVLGQVNTVLDEVRRGVGPAGQVTQDIAQATTRLNAVLAKADTALADLQEGRGTLGKLLTSDSLYTELTGSLAQINAAVKDLRDGEGTLGKLAKSTEVYNEALGSLQDVRRMVASVKQNSDAIKALPVVRSYVVDPYRELVRPHCKQYCMWFSEKWIFQPGTAVLTSEGRGELDGVAEWLNSHRERGAEIVVAAFAPSRHTPEYAQTLTQRQSEAVVDYLKTHKVHKTGWMPWSTRAVRALGWGNAPYPVPLQREYPEARIEIFLFVPQN
jgi:phospholipid/cholesterol/gamma-HCH transport system substrate-binding protein